MMHKISNHIEAKNIYKIYLSYQNNKVDTHVPTAHLEFPYVPSCAVPWHPTTEGTTALYFMCAFLYSLLYN